MSRLPDFRLAAGIGATIMSKDRYDRLSDDHKALLRRVTWEYHEQLIKIIREKNEESINVLTGTGTGIEAVLVTSAEQAKWKEAALDVQNKLAGRLFPQDLLDEVRKLLTAFRSAPVKKSAQ